MNLTNVLSFQLLISTFVEFNLVTFNLFLWVFVIFVIYLKILVYFFIGLPSFRPSHTLPRFIFVYIGTPSFLPCRGPVHGRDSLE